MIEPDKTIIFLACISTVFSLFGWTWETFKKKKKEVTNEDNVLSALKGIMLFSASFVVFVIICFIIALRPH